MQQTAREQKPINPDEVGEGRFCMQIMYRAQGKLHCHQAIGPTTEILKDHDLRNRAIFFLLMAALANAAAAEGIVLSDGDISTPTAKDLKRFS